MKKSALLLTVLLAITPSLFADDHGKKERKSEHAGEHKGKIERRASRINNDVNRLESILATAQNAPVTLSKPSLKRVANEANMLANRILANVRTTMRGRSDAVSAATQLRMHVREMHKAAAKGNAAGVRLHAREALPFALRIDSLV